MLLTVLQQRTSAERI